MSGRGRIAIGQADLFVDGKRVGGMTAVEVDLHLGPEGLGVKIVGRGIDADTERGFTLHRPWGEAIVFATKRLENRPNPPPIHLLGKRIVIHAGKEWDEGGAPSCLGLWSKESPATFRGFNQADYPAGVFLGTARIAGAVGDDGHRMLHTKETERQVILAGEAVQEDRAPWWIGPWALVLDEIRRLKQPVPSEPGVFHRGYWRLGPKDRENLAAAEWEDFVPNTHNAGPFPLKVK